MRKEIVFDINPVSRPRMTQSDKWKKRPSVLKYRRFKDNINMLANLQGFVLPGKFEVVFYMPFPNSYYKNKSKIKRLSNNPHQITPDLDNLCKALCDALAENDSYIWSISMQKIWAKEGRIVITWEEESD